MDIIPLLKVKLVVPEIPGRVLFSGRIKNLNISGYRTVIITAPAGFGKTTAVLLSLRKDRDNVRWYRMEREDSFLPVFYAHLIETLLGQEAKDTTDSARSLASIDRISEEYPLLNAVICQDSWARYSQSKSPVYLVLDDFHNVADNPVIIESVRYFTNNMPPNLQIIIMSRVDTGIADGKLSLSSDLLLVNEQHLRFTKEEIEKLTSDIYKVKVESGEIDNVLKYTEGWIAGITMLSHAAASELSAVEKKFAYNNQDKHQIFRYFLSETLNGSDKDMLKTLSRISILKDFTIGDLKSVFELQDAAELISWLERSNLYIQRINAGHTSYRFHSLFRSALHSFLHELFTPDEISDMNLRAAYHYKETGAFNNAIRFLLAAGKSSEAITLATAEGVRFMDNGDVDGVTSIVQEFSEDLIQSSGALLFLYGAAHMRVEYEQSHAYLRKSFFRFRESGEMDLLIKSVGLMIAISFQRSDFKNINNIISHIPKFKIAVKSKYARTTLLMSGLMSTAWTDKLALGDLLYKLIGPHDSCEPLWAYTCNLAKCILLYRKGDLDAAAEKVEQILNHPVALTNDHWRTIGLSVCHMVTSLRGDCEGSQRLVEDLASIGEKYNSDYATACALMLAAHIKYQNRDIEGAVAQLEEASAVSSRYGNLIMTGVNRMNKYLWEAEYAQPGPLAEKAAEELKELFLLKLGQGLMELCQANTGTLFKEAGSYTEAESLLLKAYKISKSKKARHSICGTAMQLADLYYRKKEYALEEKYLRIWGKAAADNGYVYFREMNYPALVRVCARCIEKNINADYMPKLIGKYFNTDNAARMAKDPAKAVADPKSFIAGCSPAREKTKLINIKLFGSFKMVVDNVEIGENEWKTRKICGILKYILANPGKTVSRETLATSFWPESDSKAAYTSLRVALFELKKLLARFGMAFESEDALIAEGKNGFCLCSRNIIKTDADRFSGLYGKYKSEKLSPVEMQDLLVQMVELYEGDFLEDDSYAEWAVLSRERYRAIFVEVSYKLAELCMAGGESERAEALLVRHMKVDPFDEKACSMLMYVYDSTGRKNQAASMRRQFEKRFETEMGVKPDFKYPYS